MPYDIPKALHIIKHIFKSRQISVFKLTGERPVGSLDQPGWHQNSSAPRLRAALFERSPKTEARIDSSFEDVESRVIGWKLPVFSYYLDH
jgi:hypothetical protein